jgi:hypothetical protein
MIPLSPLGYIRLAGIAVIAGLLIWLGLIVNGWRNDAERLAIVELERDQALADLSQERLNVVEAQEASRGYQSELQDLRVAATRERIPVVRLCKSAPQAREPLPAAGAGPDAAAAPSGPLPQEDEVHRDLGPELFELADRADELSAQVRGLQEYAGSCGQ